MHSMTMPGRRGDRIVKVWERLASERVSHDAFQLADHIVIFRRDQCERVASAFSASRATDTVDVGVSCVRHVIVDDVCNTFDVETACRNISGDHDGKVSCFEAVQSVLALALCAVTMQACDSESRVSKLARHFIGTMFGAGEDEYGVTADLLEKFQQ